METGYGLPPLPKQTPGSDDDACVSKKTEEERRSDFEYWDNKRVKAPDGINSEYYQISPEILNCLPRYHFPLDLHEYSPSAISLSRVYKANTRINNKRRIELYALCHQGLLFVSRSSHDIYTEYMTSQLDLILLDANLTVSEISSTLIRAFGMRLAELFHHMTREKFDALKSSVDILVEYLIQDMGRTEDLLSGCQMMNEPENRMAGAAIVALAIYARHYKGRIDYDELGRTALGFFLYDIGMTRIPKFIVNKEKPLEVKELDRVRKHPLVGVDILGGFQALDKETVAPCLEHHERMDGSGYPRKLSGTEVSMPGRIMAVADSYAAMTTKRPYAQAVAPVKAVLMLSADKSKYDPKLCTTLLSLKLHTDHDFKTIFNKAAMLKRLKSQTAVVGDVLRGEAARIPVGSSRGKSRDKSKEIAAIRDKASRIRSEREELLKSQAMAYEKMLNQSHDLFCRFLKEQTARFDPEKVCAAFHPFKQSVRRHMLYEYVAKLARLRRKALEEKAKGNDAMAVAVKLAKRIEQGFCDLVSEEFNRYAHSYVTACRLNVPSSDLDTLARDFHDQTLSSIRKLSIAFLRQLCDR